MTEQEKSLWQRIQHFQLDEPGVAFNFSARLTRENGWSPGYTKRVIAEYKRFIFLCCVSEQGVTPSDPVDQAWHLHLTFTRSYWIDFCKNTLQKEIHHNPTKGGKQEAKKFDRYYTSSHQLYVEKFGSTPPTDIWQDNHTRFSEINFKRINVGRYWLIRKPKLSTKLLITLMLLPACAFLIQADGGTWMWGVVSLAIIRISIAGAVNDRQKKRTSNGKDGDNDGCDGGGGGDDGNYSDDSHHHSGGHHYGDSSDSGCSSGCSGCSGSGCSGCGGGGD